MRRRPAPQQHMQLTTDEHALVHQLLSKIPAVNLWNNVSHAFCGLGVGIFIDSLLRLQYQYSRGNITPEKQLGELFFTLGIASLASTFLLFDLCVVGRNNVKLQFAQERFETTLQPTHPSQLAHLNTEFDSLSRWAMLHTTSAGIASASGVVLLYASFATGIAPVLRGPETIVPLFFLASAALITNTGTNMHLKFRVTELIKKLTPGSDTAFLIA